MSPGNHVLDDAPVYNGRPDTPLRLSDFTARPRVIQALGRVDGLQLWDLDYVEGFFGRQLPYGLKASIGQPR
jgi:hypothetical protein